MIKTKKELINILSLTKKSKIDTFIEFRVSEELLRSLLDDREKDNEYFFEKMDSIDKGLDIITKDMKKKNLDITRLRIQRDNWKRIARGSSNGACAK